MAAESSKAAVVEEPVKIEANVAATPNDGQVKGLF